MPNFYVNLYFPKQTETISEHNDRQSALAAIDTIKANGSQHTYKVSTRATRAWYEAKRAQKNRCEFNRQIIQLMDRIAVVPEFKSISIRPLEWYSFSDRYGWMRLSLAPSTSYLTLHCQFDDIIQSLPVGANECSGKYNYHFGVDSSKNLDYVNGCVASIVIDLKSNNTPNAIAARKPTAGEIAAFVAEKDRQSDFFYNALVNADAGVS